MAAQRTPAAAKKNGAAPSRQARRAAERKAAKAPAAPTPAPEQEAANGVLVVRQEDGNGGYSALVQPVGDVRVTEIETLLKLALKGFRERAGLTE